MSNEWSDEDLYQAVGTITRQFPLLKCHECVIAIRSWLSRRQVPSKIWKISTKNDDEDFIVSDRLEQQGITDSMTDNGVHYGVEVRGQIFDNLSPEGMALEDWVQDFHSISDELEITCFDDY